MSASASSAPRNAPRKGPATKKSPVSMKVCIEWLQNLFNTIFSDEDLKILETYLDAKFQLLQLEGVDHILATLLVKSGKKGDDEIYAENPILVKIVPRAFSILVKKDDNTIVASVCGLRKFTGCTPGDDDDEVAGGESDVKAFELLREKFRDNTLTVFRTEKLNGKNCVVTLFKSSRDNLYALCGSKNSHVVCSITPSGERNNIAVITSSDLEGKVRENSSIVNDVVANLRLIIDKVLTLTAYAESLLPILLEYTICGELCDGLHFCRGEFTEGQIPVLRFFGVSKMGVALSGSLLEKLSQGGLPICSKEEVKPCPQESFEAFINRLTYEVRSGENEGSVIYFYYPSSESEESVHLMKLKTARYILLRTMRALLMNIQRGSASVTDIYTRVRDRANYHGLRAFPASVACKKLIAFAVWMLSQKIPFETLDCQSRGFYNIWNEYITTTSEDNDIVFTPEDFGVFQSDEFDFSHLTEDSVSEKKKTFTIFMQGIQGSGKTTLALALCEYLSSQGKKCIVIEQDHYGGSRGLTLLKFFVSLTEEYDYIFISRMNRNSSEYTPFLKECVRGKSEFIFLSPNISSMSEYIDVCYRRVLSRTEESNHSFRVGDTLTAEEIRSIMNKNLPKTQGGKGELQFNETSLKYPFSASVEEVVASVSDKLLLLPSFNKRDLFEGFENVIVSYPLSGYSCLIVDKDDCEKLCEVVSSIVKVSPSAIVSKNFHLTVHHSSSQAKKNFCYSLGEKVYFRVSGILIDGDRVALSVGEEFDRSTITSGVPHLTYSYPKGGKASESIELFSRDITPIDVSILVRSEYTHIYPSKGH